MDLATSAYYSAYDDQEIPEGPDDALPDAAPDHAPQKPITIMFSDAFASAARRLRNAQASDGQREFIGTVRIRFVLDEDADPPEVLVIDQDDRTWTTTTGEEIDIRTLRE